MYSIYDYGWMIADEARMGFYLRALESVVRPGMVVADIGTGTGILSLLACRLGATRVYAIDTNDAIEVGRELARENGFVDRIVFFHKDARQVQLPERVDVIVSDLYGTLPLCGNRLAVLADVRHRFLKADGAMIPMSDRLMVAVVEKPDLYDSALGPSIGPLGVTLEAMRERLRNATCLDRANPLRPEDVVSTAMAWATLDYATLKPAAIAGRANLRIKRAAVGHGLAVWFEAVLADGHELSTAPGHELCYGRLFLPWPRPVALAEADRVTVHLWAQTGGDPWGWNSTLTRATGVHEAFKQSSFLAFAGKLTHAVASGMDGLRLANAQELT